jgi:hypothetical protein
MTTSTEEPDLTCAELIDVHEAAKAELAELTAAFNAMAAPLKQQIDDSQSLLLDTLNKQGTKATIVETDTHNIRVGVEIKEQFSIKDRGAFNAWVVANDAAGIFQARINVAAMNEITDQLPPGVTVFRENVIAIRRTAKKI